MDFKGILIIAVIAFVIMSLGGGIFYLIWIMTRAKKMTWNAWVYQLGDGIVPLKKEVDGKVQALYKLSDLKPYTTDVVEKVDKKSGATHYWMNRLKKAVPVVTADCVEVWGDKKKWVRILLEGDTCTLLKSAYDRKYAEQIFRPMPHERINMIKTEMDERNERIHNTKDILAQITPFITIGISLLALVVCVYFVTQASIRIAELTFDASELMEGAIGDFNRVYMEVNGIMPDFLNRTLVKGEVPVLNP